MAIALMIAGIAIAIPTFIAGVVPVVRTMRGTIRFDAPSTVRVHLRKATYMVYEDTGRSSIGSPFSSPGNVTIGPGDVTVSAADNTNVEVYDRGTVRETLSSRGDRFVGAARFTTPTSGDYTISVRSPAPKAFLIARPLSDTIGSVVGWFALAGFGGVVLLVGVVLLIVGSVRRGRARNALVHVAPPAPGWHPDPWGTGRWRYWDGYRWTEHVQ
jgi:hypothetical protein